MNVPIHHFLACFVRSARHLKQPEWGLNLRYPSESRHSKSMHSCQMQRRWRVLKLRQSKTSECHHRSEFRARHSPDSLSIKLLRDNKGPQTRSFLKRFQSMPGSCQSYLSTSAFNFEPAPIGSMRIKDLNCCVLYMR